MLIEQMVLMSLPRTSPPPLPIQSPSDRAATTAVTWLSKLTAMLHRHSFPITTAWAAAKGAVIGPLAPITWIVLISPARYFTVRAHIRAARLPKTLLGALRRRHGGVSPRTVEDAVVVRSQRRPAVSIPSHSHRPVGTASGRRRARARIPIVRNSLRGTVEVASSGINAFISSDLHRTPPGRRDWVHTQGNVDLYCAVLEHYGSHGWHLIENGDVEDFWMVGGSPWGVAYDMSRLAGTAMGPLGGPLRRAAYIEHLNRIITNHSEIYERIERLFHFEGRYLRIIGNHDDVYYEPKVAEALRLHFPGLRIADYLILGRPPSNYQTAPRRRRPQLGVTPDAVITHGHITDPWNSAGGAWRGKTVTWHASLLGDLPGGTELGQPLRTRTPNEIVNLPNVLTTLGHWMSLDHNHQTLDESQLHRSFVNHWGEGSGPWLICGHTHAPLNGPVDPSDYTRFSRYLNSGSGIYAGFITGIEWRGAENADPVLVGYSFGPGNDAGSDEIAATGEVVMDYRGRPLIRTEFVADPADRLQARVGTELAL